MSDHDRLAAEAIFAHHNREHDGALLRLDRLEQRVLVEFVDWARDAGWLRATRRRDKMNDPMKEGGMTVTDAMVMAEFHAAMCERHRIQLMRVHPSQHGFADMAVEVLCCGNCARNRIEAALEAREGQDE